MNKTSNPWDNLPNAKHIDRILTSYHQYPDIWVSALRKWADLFGEELQDQAYYEAKTKCKELDRLGIWTDRNTPGIGPILTLIAYDDCAHYLDMPSQELTTIALLGAAPAVLLLRAVIAFEEIAKIPNQWLRLFRFITQYWYSK